MRLVHSSQWQQPPETRSSSFYLSKEDHLEDDCTLTNWWTFFHIKGKSKLQKMDSAYLKMLLVTNGIRWAERWNESIVEKSYSFTGKRQDDWWRQDDITYDSNDDYYVYY